jgi:hypothetical protein
MAIACKTHLSKASDFSVSGGETTTIKAIAATLKIDLARNLSI